MKTCKTCGVEKDLADFPKSGKYHCADCRICYNKKRRKDQADWYAKNKEKRLMQKRNQYQQQRQTVFEYYGKVCACCGETEPLFLTIDHIDNSGHLHRKGTDTSHNNIYYWLIKNKFPSGFQTLCMNCNTGKHKNNGICPHKNK